MSIDARVLPKAHLRGAIVDIEDAHIPVLDRGFLFGDAVYEVVPVYQGKLFRIESHLQRLMTGLEKIGVRSPHNDDQWKQLLNELVAANGSTDMFVYIQVSRGVASYRDHSYAVPLTPLVFAMCQKLVKRPASQNIKGMKAVLLEDTRWAHCDIKSTSLLANVLLRQQAVDGGYFEAILHRDGQVTEGAASTIMLVLNGALVCPPNTQQILPGTTRSLVVELAKTHNIECQIRPFTVDELLHADEVLMSAATKELMPIVQVGDSQIGDGKPGPIWQRLDDAYQLYKRSGDST